MRALILATLLAACGNDHGAPGMTTDPGADAAAMTDPPLDPLPPAGGQQLATPSYMLAPGAEVYMCYQFYSPDDAVAITHLDEISMPGVHHFVIYQTTSPEPDAPHECNVIIKTSWMPIWATGTGSKSMDLPQGTGFIIQPKTQYVVQLHMQNATDSPMTIRAGANLTYDHNPSALTAAGLYALGTFDLDIPPVTTDFTKTIDCKVDRTLNVFTVFPHMHKLGTQLDVTYTPAAGGTAAPFYSIDPWTFGNQPMDPLVKTVNVGDDLNATCHYNNPSNQDVKYGESSDDEMCFFVMFYYPFDGLAGCID